MPTILTLTANPLLDHLASTVIAPGVVNRVERFAAVAGGKGLNMGRVLARHGHRVLACTFAGGASGEELGALIAADGMEPVLVPTAARTRIGFLAVDPERGGTTAVLENGFAVSAAELGALLQRIRSLLPGLDLVLVGGSVPHPSAHGLFRQVLDLCAGAQLPCWVDAYGEAMDEALGGAHPPTLVKPNRQEYGRGRKWLPSQELHLTDGGGEIKVRHPSGRWRVLPPRVKELNPVGSGDCYLAALAHARLSGSDLAGQLRYAAAAGAANAARADVARISPADILALCDQVEITSLSE
jgi:fructose-1-phosphate kinase PfkB-like protein